MTRYLLAAASVIILAAASLHSEAAPPKAVPSKAEPSTAATLAIPSEISMPSSVGEITFRHQMHISDLSIKCAACHHEINAKTFNTPHPGYLESSSIKCEICHNESEKIKQKAYACSGCHRTNPINIADETLSAKVVIHKQCWNCHPVGSGKDASKGCSKCHSGKRTQ